MKFGLYGLHKGSSIEPDTLAPAVPGLLRLPASNRCGSATTLHCRPMHLMWPVSRGLSS